MKTFWINPLKAVPALGAVLMFLAASPTPALAGDWSFSFSSGSHRGHGLDYRSGHRRHRGHHYRDGFRIALNPRIVYRSFHYYPRYQPVFYRHHDFRNPVYRRDVYRDGHYNYDGTHHSERVTEDRHRSYYSPGRNHAITPPRTRVVREHGPGYVQERERTSWIGADGRPHSTTVERTTTKDRWGDTHTDTHVDLRNTRPPSQQQVSTVLPGRGEKTIAGQDELEMSTREKKPSYSRLRR